MLNLFSPQHFLQMRDAKNSLYVLQNTQEMQPDIFIDALTAYLATNHNLIFTSDDNG